MAHTLRGHIHQGREGIAVGAGALAYIVIVLSKQCVQEITRLGYNPREPVPSYQHSPSRNQFSSFPVRDGVFKHMTLRRTFCI